MNIYGKGILGAIPSHFSCTSVYTKRQSPKVIKAKKEHLTSA